MFRSRIYYLVNCVTAKRPFVTYLVSCVLSNGTYFGRNSSGCCDRRYFRWRANNQPSAHAPGRCYRAVLRRYGVTAWYCGHMAVQLPGPPVLQERHVRQSHGRPKTCTRLCASVDTRRRAVAVLTGRRARARRISETLYTLVYTNWPAPSRALAGNPLERLAPDVEMANRGLLSQSTLKPGASLLTAQAPRRCHSAVLRCDSVFFAVLHLGVAVLHCGLMGPRRCSALPHQCSTETGAFEPRYTPSSYTSVYTHGPACVHCARLTAAGTPDPGSVMAQAARWIQQPARGERRCERRRSRACPRLRPEERHPEVGNRRFTGGRGAV